jgi:hypothetical protein
MTPEEVGQLHRAAGSVLAYLEKHPLPMRFEVLAMANTYLQIESARAQREPQVRDEP